MRAAALLLALFAFALPTAAADADLFAVTGRYETISPPLPTAADDQVEVVELFWYGCPHCHDFEPHLRDWLASAPDHVSFRQVPAVFRKSWLPHAHAYYAAEIMGVLDRFHLPLFDALHNKKRRIFTREALADFVAEQGIDRAEFLRTYDSFAVQARVKQAILYTQRSEITGVPSMVINGKYRTSGSMAGGFANVIQVVRVLVAEEARTMGLEAAGDAVSADGG